MAFALVKKGDYFQIKIMGCEWTVEPCVNADQKKNLKGECLRSSINSGPDKTTHNGVDYYIAVRPCEDTDDFLWSAPGWDLSNAFSVQSCGAGTKFVAGNASTDASCVRVCDAGTEHTVVNSTSTCTACAPGTFQPLDASTNACSAFTVTSCVPGQGLTAGTPSSDGSCGACANGTFSNGLNPCAAFTVGPSAVFDARAVTSYSEIISKADPTKYIAWCQVRHSQLPEQAPITLLGRSALFPPRPA